MNKFTELGLSQPLVAAISALGFEEPTPIQQKAIPLLLEDNTDFIGLAQTGTGKTAAFGLPLLDLVDTEQKHTQALLLAPTRELCLQIMRELEQFAKNIKKLKIRAVYGGVDINKQIREIKSGAHIIAATPGRLRDLMRRKVVDIRHVEYVILDEADEMLNMGFKEEIDEILQDTPEDKLTWLFSATMPTEVRQISKNYMNKPKEYSAGTRNTSNVDIDHQYVIVRPRERYEVLRRFLDFEPETFGLVFTRTRRDARELADKLVRDGYSADALHGDLNQTQRDRVMERFRKRRIQVLVATDVAARGIDVNEITHVFHYNIPEDIHFYTHRSGRTGRAGKKGISLVLTHPKDKGLLYRLEKVIKAKFTEVTIPSGKDICARQLIQRFKKINDTEINFDIEPFLPQLMEEVEGLSREDLIRKIAAMYFRKSLRGYLNAPEFGKNGRKKVILEKTRRLFINIGSVDVNDKGGFLSFVCETTKVPGSAIGKINMNRTHSFFDVEEGSASKIIEVLDDSTFSGRKLRVNEDAPQQQKFEKKKKKKGKKKRRQYQ